MTYAAPGAPPADWAEGPLAGLRRLASRIGTLCWVELLKMRHDRTELYTRAIQPALWLLIYGETFTRIHAIPTPKGIPYMAYLSPGILAQSALFIAIFYGIQIIWERDAGVLAKLMVTPTPRAALITGKAFAAGVRSLVQGIVVVVLSAVLGVALTDNPLKLLAGAGFLVLGSAFFSCLSMTIAGIAVKRDRLMGIGWHGEGLARGKGTAAAPLHKPDADGGTACLAYIARTGAPRGAAPPHSVTIQAPPFMYKS